jgi:6-pyruvoyltetrahydropterin/6-carboxytetrahydropterin synthase
MFRVSREIDFCYGHRLLNYEGKCRYLHGHNGRAIITIEASQLDPRGMVFDFSDIKQVVSRWIDEELDHRMLLCHDDPVVPFLQKLGEPIHLMETNPTAENIAKLIYDYTLEQGFPVVEVRLWETPRCYATYAPEGPTGNQDPGMAADAACCGPSRKSQQEETQ